MYSRGFCLGFFVISDTVPCSGYTDASHSKTRKLKNHERETVELTTLSPQNRMSL